MATLALSFAGQAIGGLVGGPIGATVGRALGALAGSALDNAIFGAKPQAQAEGADIRLTGSSAGGAIPRLYGWSRLSGNIIWATRLEEMTGTSSGAKGTSQTDSQAEILASFAVAFCEGEVAHLGRIWADGQVLETEGLTIRFYRGTEDQLPDGLVEAKQGAGNAPAYRGLCYLVFEQLPLSRFGNRIPSISVELCRVVGTLEPAITAVTVIPAATEFGYDPTPRVRLVSPGVTAAENTHQSADLSDWAISLDTLQALCPNLRHVSLVVAWFGDDLRAGQCTVAPRVESATRSVSGADWVVSGVGRGGAGVVSTYDSGAAYGGTPSDGAVLAAIADLKARGLAVTLYPMLLMDIPAGNTLPDPYGGASQPAYPWRGRVTCDPAPGAAGTPDLTAAVTAQIAAFLGSATPGQFSAAGTTVAYAGSGWGYRRMLLHYARLAAMAGGIDALLIGSELRGLTTLRDETGAFPLVAALAALAADVRTITGPTTKLTYAADWSEFSGYQPADALGDKYFHLDALWAAADIDAIGIDNYMPIADWRDGTDHADAALADSPYDLGYLQANIAGGEGYDWYYASEADRIAGVRTPILDGAYGEPWVWRFKDIVGWWQNAHHDRIGGVRRATPTAWVPQSKPLWFTELGCGAVDKGANQPNAFGDAKSAENARPHFSDGAPDPLMQRQFLRAHLGWWRPDAPGFIASRNPVSAAYGGHMLDADRIYLWTWDARPYPAFPQQSAVWADAANHATGHWLTGRLGALASDELVAAMAADYGLAVPSARAASPLISGASRGAVESLRDGLDPVLSATGLAIRDRPQGLEFALPSARISQAVTVDQRVATDGPLTARKRPDPTEILARLALGYLDRERDYLSGTVTAMRLESGGTSGRNSELVLDAASARHAAERLLSGASASGETLDLALPPAFAALEVGDALAVDGQGAGPFLVTQIRDGYARRVSAQRLAGTQNAAIVTDQPAVASLIAVKAVPLVWAAQLPPAADDPSVSRLLLAAAASPWPGRIGITDPATGATVGTLTGAATMGLLDAPFAAGALGVWDNAATLSLTLYSGHLSGLADLAVLGGGNRIAVETDAGNWEIVGFARADLIAPNQYRLSRLLRGLEGTSDAVGAAGAGRRAILLDGRAPVSPLPATWLGGEYDLQAYAGPADAVGVVVTLAPGPAPLLPLSPVHLTAVRAGGDVALAWMRRSRADADSWAPADAPLDFAPETYEVTVFDGATPVRSVSVATPSWTYPASDQIADFGAAPAGFTFTVAQSSPVYGPGAAASGAFHG